VSVWQCGWPWHWRYQPAWLAIEWQWLMKAIVGLRRGSYPAYYSAAWNIGEPSEKPAAWQRRQAAFVVLFSGGNGGRLLAIRSAAVAWSEDEIDDDEAVAVAWWQPSGRRRAYGIDDIRQRALAEWLSGGGNGRASWRGDGGGWYQRNVASHASCSAALSAASGHINDGEINGWKMTVIIKQW